MVLIPVSCMGLRLRRIFKPLRKEYTVPASTGFFYTVGFRDRQAALQIELGYGKER